MDCARRVEKSEPVHYHTLQNIISHLSANDGKCVKVYATSGARVGQSQETKDLLRGSVVAEPKESASLHLRIF